MDPSIGHIHHPISISNREILLITSIFGLPHLVFAPVLTTSSSIRAEGSITKGTPTPNATVSSTYPTQQQLI
jgi:hypothetical protein